MTQERTKDSALEKEVKEVVDSWGEIPFVVLTGAGASAAEPLSLPTTAEFWDRASDEVGSPPHLLARLQEITAAGEGTKDIECLWRVLELAAREPYGLRYLVALGLAQQGDRTVADHLRVAEKALGPASGVLKELAGGRRWVRRAIFSLYGGFSDPHRRADAQQVYGRLLEVLSETAEVIPIFTTNYDMALECLAADLLPGLGEGAHLNDGFLADRLGTDPYWTVTHYKIREPDQRPAFLLIKLHGSLNWVRRITDGAVLRSPQAAAEREPGMSDVLIYPGQHDDQAESPFSEALMLFREALKRAERLAVIGFSMRDVAIQRAVLSAAKAGTLRVLLVDTAEELTGEWAAIAKALPRRFTHWRAEFGPPDVSEAIAKWCHAEDVRPPGK